MSYQTQHLQIPRIQINTAKRNGEPEQQRVKHGGIGLTTRIARQRTPARSLKRCLKLQPNHRHDTLWYLCQPNAMGFMTIADTNDTGLYEVKSKISKRPESRSRQIDDTDR
ncbi:hypothetical protein PC114_g23751 [Phytophthora cactorum]|nr:hypothetical protein PC114_g23751 [Phytophthora cactorum]